MGVYGINIKKKKTSKNRNNFLKKGMEGVVNGGNIWLVN